MKEAKIRATLAKGTNRGHAYYEDWQSSVVDLCSVLCNLFIRY